MRILVTGNLGYIGTALTPILQAAGHDVVGYDADLFRRCTFKAGGPMAEVTTVRKDTRDVELADLEGFDAVCHLAALSNDVLGNLKPEITYEINHLATVRVAELAKKAGVSRFAFASSCSNYGASGGDDLLDESASFHPVTAYGISKVRSEEDLTALADDSFSPTYLRCATAYGVTPRMRFDIVLNNLVAWAHTSGRVHLKSDGTPWRPIVHVRDIALAYLAVLEAPREAIHNQAFNVGRTEENYRIRDLAEIVARAVPGCRVEMAEGASPDLRNYRVRCDKILRQVPSFEPEWTAARGAAELYEAFRTSNLSLDEFEGPRYQRIAHLRQLMDRGIVGPDLRHRPECEAAA